MDINLEKLKKHIESLDSEQQLKLYNDCISKIKKIKKTVNKNGVFFDLQSISLDNLKMIIEYVSKINIV